jgi:hypothetical protein
MPLIDELDECKEPVAVGDHDNDGHGDLFLANAKGSPLRTSVTGITGITATPPCSIVPITLDLSCC